MKNNLVFILIVSLFITLSDARQSNPFSKENVRTVSEFDLKLLELINSADYKRFQQFFDSSVYVSKSEQKTILQNTSIQKLRALELPRNFEEIEELIFFLKLSTKEQQVIYDFRFMYNPTIPSNYFESMHDEKEYKMKEEKIWQMLQKLPYSSKHFICPSFRRLPKYTNELLSLLAVLYSVNHIESSTFFERQFKGERFPVLTCNSHEYTIDVDYQNFLTKDKREYTELEELYRKVFLLMMEEDILKRSRYVLIPLSIMREHAAISGLSNYILSKIIQADNKLTHHDLAIQYYGSLDNWMIDIFKFLKKEDVK